MKLTIISDIHADINKKKNYDYSSLTDAYFVIVAGDVSGDPLSCADWAKRNLNRGIFIEGNHLGYNTTWIPELDNREGAVKYLKKKFDGSDGVKFLENSTHEEQDVLFIGCTLFTDFNLFGTPELSMGIAGGSDRRLGMMNDFNYVSCLEDKKQRTLYPRKTVAYHKKSVRFIEKTCKANPDKKIVIVTHHCPSKQSIDSKYVGDLFNPAYASDLEWLINKYDNIRLWIHGHVHAQKDYMIGNTRVVCNPFGYGNENNLPFDSLGLVIDTDEL